MGGATYQDVIDAPPHMVAELVDGELYLQPRPAQPHTKAASTLGMWIGGAYQLGRGGPGGWWIQDEPELHFDAQVLVPDLAGWRRGRAEPDLTAAYVEVAPAWICEVLLPSTRRHDRVRKLPVYARYGVAHAWLVDPLDETVEVFELDRERWTLWGARGGRETVQLPPFQALELPLDELWVPRLGGS